MSDDTQTKTIPNRIKGAKLGDDGVWRDLEGRVLSTADLIRLRDAEAQEKADRAKERERAKSE